MRGSPTQLSICIPTYNRGAMVCTLAKTILNQLPYSLRSVTELVISDNWSSDDTGDRLKQLEAADKRIRVVCPPHHFQTAEENLCFAISESRGEYVWTLGDDDGIRTSTLPIVEEIITRGEVDLAIFNSAAVSYDGVLKVPVQIRCLSPRLDIPFLDFIRLTGFWYTIAGFSTTLFRRSSGDIDKFKDILKVGRIYSHVIWLIACFHDKSFTFVNRPLVNYRENLYVTVQTNHWEKVCLREGTFDGVIWSTGFLRLCEYLVAQKIFAVGFVREVVDRNPHNRFYFADEMLHHFLRGLRKDIVLGEGRVDADEVSYFLKWAQLIWADNIVLLAKIAEIQRLKSAQRPVPADLVTAIEAILKNRSTRPWFDVFHVYTVFGYSVYKHCGRWFAIRLGCSDELRGKLEFLDFDGVANKLIVSSSEEALLACISEIPPFVPPSLGVDDPMAQQSSIESPSAANVAPSPLKRALIAVWDAMPRGVQTIVEPLADRIDKWID